MIEHVKRLVAGGAITASALAACYAVLWFAATYTGLFLDGITGIILLVIAYFVGVAVEVIVEMRAEN